MNFLSTTIETLKTSDNSIYRRFNDAFILHKPLFYTTMFDANMTIQQKVEKTIRLIKTNSIVFFHAKSVIDGCTIELNEPPSPLGAILDNNYLLYTDN